MVASAGPGEYRQAIEVVLTGADADALIVVFTPIDESKTTGTLAGIQAGIAAARARGVHKPVLACIMSDSTDHLPLRVWSGHHSDLPVPENAARALGKVASVRVVAIAAGRAVLDLRRCACRRGARDLSPGAGAGRLVARRSRCVGHPERVRHCRSPPQPGAHRRRGRRVRVRHRVSSGGQLASTKVTHKTELGVVRLSLATADDVRAAFTES